MFKDAKMQSIFDRLEGIWITSKLPLLGWVTLTLFLSRSVQS